MSALLFCMASSHAEDVLTVDNVILPQNGEVAIEIMCNFESNFTMMELTIELPEGLSLKKDKYGLPWAELGTEGTDHTFTSSTPSSTTYQYVCSSMHQEPLPSSGVLMRVTAIAEEGLEIGTVFNGSVKDILLSEHTSEGNNVGHKFDDITFTVAIGEPLDTRTLLDENSTTAPTEATGVDVRVRRTIKSGQWSTICLPFAMTEAQVKTAFGEDVELADFTSWSSEEDDEGAIVAINVVFTTVSEMEANHPYIIKVSSPVSEFTVDGVDIEPEEEPKVQVGKRAAERGWMYGTYMVTTVPEENVFLSDNKFWYSTGNTTTKGLRGYFEFRDVLDAYYDADGAGARINMVFGDGTTTAIHETMNSEFSTMNCYDLQGRRVVKPGKGMYIQNGKKVMQ